MGKYDDIINLPHHQSDHRPHMSLHDRAAQFSPFAALTGYEAAIEEAGRLTEGFREIDEGEKAALDETLSFLEAHKAEQPKISVLHFEQSAFQRGPCLAPEFHVRADRKGGDRRQHCRFRMTQRKAQIRAGRKERLPPSRQCDFGQLARPLLPHRICQQRPDPGAAGRFAPPGVNRDKIPYLRNVCPIQHHILCFLSIFVQFYYIYHSTKYIL